MSNLPPDGIKLVVFDLDGTLVDTMPNVLRAFQRAVAPSREVHCDEIFANLGGPPRKVIEALLTDTREIDAAVALLEANEAGRWHLSELFPGAREVLGELQTKGCQCALWTGRDRESAEQILETHDLLRYFSGVICGDDLPTHKPHPAGLLRLLERCCIAAEATIMVGDSDADVLGAQRAGVASILIDHGRTMPVEVTDFAFRTVKYPATAYQLLAGI